MPLHFLLDLTGAGGQIALGVRHSGNHPSQRSALSTIRCLFWRRRTGRPCLRISCWT